MFEFPQKTEAVIVVMEAIKNEKAVIRNLWTYIQEI